jgi:putative DNA primase/helicase
MVISNELPRFQDASAAIAGRFITLQLLESWLGKEDITLEPELHGELAGILNWSLEGLDRLAETNRFTEPESSREAFVRLQELASPVAAFVRDCCDVGPQYEVEIDAMWKEWQRWRNENGVARFGSKQLFGRNLHSAYPGIKRGQLRASADKRIPIYRGIRLKERPPVIERTSETSVRIR